MFPLIIPVRLITGILLVLEFVSKHSTYFTKLHVCPVFKRVLCSPQVVVMACREVEMGKKKCEMYWPVVQRSMQHGAITITTVNT